MYTYAQIDAMSCALAFALKATSGVEEDDEAKVVMLVEEGVGLVVCELAVLKAGAAFVPVDPNWPAQRQAFIISDCAAKLVLMQRTGAQALIKKLTDAGLCVLLPGAGEITECGNAPGGAHVSVTALIWEDSVYNNPRPASTNGNTRCHPGFHNPSALVRLDIPRNMACRTQRASHVIYTSGTSGQPKGVVCEHRSLVAYMSAKARSHGIRGHELRERDACQDDDGAVGGSATPEEARAPQARAGKGGRSICVSRVLVTAAATWDPSLGDIFSTLGSGAVVCLAGRAALISSLDQVLARSRATHVCTTPALWDLLPEYLTPVHLPELEVLALGGAPFPRRYLTRWGEGGGATCENRGGEGRETHAGGRLGSEGVEEAEAGLRGRRKGLRLINTYGVTEACVYQTAYVMSDVRGDESVGGAGGGMGGGGAGDGVGVAAQEANINLVGEALEGVLLEVQGDAKRRGGVRGEVLIGGEQVARGYWRKDALTAEKFFVKDGVRWFRSGDLGRWVCRADGGGGGVEMLLEVIGRLDLQVTK